MKSGLVMKITDKQVVLLCDDGKFHNIPLPQHLPALGERITIPVNDIKKKPSYGIPAKLWAVASFLVLFIGLSLGHFLMISPYQAVAMVAIDINPSVELLVNSKGKVKDAVLVNEDARSILQKKELVGKDIYYAVETVVDKAEKQGFLHRGSEEELVMVSVVDFKKNEQSFVVEQGRLTNINKDYNIKYYNIDKQTQEKAKKIGLTVNKYMVYEKTKAIGKPIKVEELRDNSVVKTLKKAGIQPQTFLENELKNVKAERNHGEKQKDREVDKKNKQDSSKNDSVTTTSEGKKPEIKNKPEIKRPEIKRPETKKSETKRPETKKSETKKSEIKERKRPTIDEFEQKKPKRNEKNLSATPPKKNG